MGIPECILTVTTRITKYPPLIEPLIKTAKERPEEQQKLRNCLHLVKSILVDVNGQVAEKERGQRLLEIYNRMDAQSPPVTSVASLASVTERKPSQLQPQTSNSALK